MAKKSNTYISNPLRLLQPSWDAILANLGGIAGVYLVALAVPLTILAIGTVVFLVTLKGGFSVLSGVIFAVVALLILLFMIAFAPAITIALLASAKGKKTEVGATLKASWQFAPAVLGSAILTFLAFMTGLVLLIIPGLIFATWFSLSSFVIVDQKVGAIEGMRRSKALVNQHVLEMWGMFSFSGFVNILNIIPVLGWIGSFALTVAYSAAPAVRYLQLKDLKVDDKAGHKTHWVNYVVIILSLIFGGIMGSNDVKNQQPNVGNDTQMLPQDSSQPSDGSAY